MKRAGEQRTDITRSNWNYDFHFLSLRQFQIPQFGNQFLNMFKKKDGGFFGRVQTVGDTGDGGLINSHIAWTDATFLNRVAPSPPFHGLPSRFTCLLLGLASLHPRLYADACSAD
ncbi:MAG: hypothetical protein DMF72_05645 [Acidobacteria bacterium]|nr:MAG: hypothetical protein DMF72_05645 [Acidobacteriota bacterium]